MAQRRGQRARDLVVELETGPRRGDRRREPLRGDGEQLAIELGEHPRLPRPDVHVAAQRVVGEQLRRQERPHPGLAQQGRAGLVGDCQVFHLQRPPPRADPQDRAIVAREPALDAPLESLVPVEQVDHDDVRRERVDAPGDDRVEQRVELERGARRVAQALDPEQQRADLARGPMRRPPLQVALRQRGEVVEQRQRVRHPGPRLVVERGERPEHLTVGVPERDAGVCGDPQPRSSGTARASSITSGAAPATT